MKEEEEDEDEEDEEDKEEDEEQEEEEEDENEEEEEEEEEVEVGAVDELEEDAPAVTARRSARLGAKVAKPSTNHPSYHTMIAVSYKLVHIVLCFWIRVCGCLKHVLTLTPWCSTPFLTSPRNSRPR